MDLRAGYINLKTRYSGAGPMERAAREEELTDAAPGAVPLRCDRAPEAAVAQRGREKRHSPGDSDRWATSVIRVACFETNLLFYGMVRVLDGLFAGVEVTAMQDIDELIGAVDRKERFDLVVLDAASVHLDGSGELARAVAALPGVPFIVTSSGEAPSDISAALEAGARGFFSMGAKIDVLQYAVPLVLKGEVYLPASIYSPGGKASWRARAPDYARWCSTTKLTTRQLDVLVMLANGASNKQIARHLGLIEGTVKMHVKAILRRLHAKNRTEAVLVAVRGGYLPKELL